ncbi:LysR substrate-binding domain-containing protein [Streptomyces sp. NPDC048111]|uniref:LysR family transcriptional regulator n=1 Tax=Streptomyces sp. NPDC048111 TaxID=3365500 RepID=UPI003715DD28
MSLRQLEYFVMVVEETSFTRAAELLHVTQPALSHQIKALEKAVGGALLERTSRGVRLTPMGRAFLPHARLAVRSAVQAERAARAAAGAEGGELHIAAVHAVAVGVLPEVFARWRRAHPGVQLFLHEHASPEALQESLERGAADLAVGPPPTRWTGPVVPVGEEEIALAVAFDDPLAHRSSVRLEEFADHAWVRCAMEPLVEGRPFLDLVCERAGFIPRTVVRTEHTSTAVRMAAAGVGVVAVPTHAVRGGIGEDCVLLSVDASWKRPLTVFSRVELAGAAAAFTELLRGSAPYGTAAPAPDEPTGGYDRRAPSPGQPTGVS